MSEILPKLVKQPAVYLIALVFLIALLLESGMRMRELRWGIAGIVYLTVGLWYFFDPVYRPDYYAWYTSRELSQVYTQVLVFLVTFRFAVELSAPKTPSSILREFDPAELDRSSVISSLMLVWGVLFIIGMYRAEFRVLDALFPLGGRWSGAQMWGRERLGGTYL